MFETDALIPTMPVENPDGPRFIRSLRLTNLLSFERGEEIELRSLNVLVGANGSGKTNFVEALGLLAAMTTNIAEPIRKGGGIGTWLNHKSGRPEFEIEIVATRRPDAVALTHSLVIGRDHLRPTISSELIRSDSLAKNQFSSEFVYTQRDGIQHSLDDIVGLDVLHDPSDQRQSALAILKDSKRYPEISHLQRLYETIRLYRSWSFGPGSALREPQPADLPNEWLAEDYRNLGLLLNRLELEPDAQAEFLALLREFLPDLSDYRLLVQGNTLQIFLRLAGENVPATRLSDGTLRWLCLLAILVAPSPPSVIVLEEPELGLHPDMINTLATMLTKAATRHQLVITTHSDILIDALSDIPEAVMVVEKGENGTTIRRLDAGSLAPWLEEYRLGRLWMQGQIGGTRW